MRLNYFKNYLFHFLLCGFLAVTFFSCSSEEDYNTDQEDLSVYMVEEAFPGEEKELITLANGMVVEKLDSMYIFQGDIILTKEQLEQFQQEGSRSAVLTTATKYWSDRKVYYSFAKNFTYQNLVRQAINHWEANTSLKFYEVTSGSNYIEFFHGDGNYSQIGKVGGKQQISLLISPYTTYGTAIHEIGHAMGLFHEQSRQDRDNYVTINWNNIESKKDHNFKIYSQDGYSGMDIGSFDFGSVMMYGQYSFSKNDLPTITKKDGSSYYIQRDRLSTGDIEGIKAIYGPPFPRLSTQLVQVHEEIFTYTWEQWDYEYSNTIYFYADETSTTRATLKYPRKLYVIYRYGSSGDEVSYNNQTVHQEYLVPAGVDSYKLPSTRNRAKYEYSNCKYEHTQNYSLMSK